MQLTDYYAKCLGKAEFPNLTVNKISKAVVPRCEWGHDASSPTVENLPKAPPPKGQRTLFGEGVPK